MIQAACAPAGRGKAGLEKTVKGIKGYEQWEEACEVGCVSELLAQSTGSRGGVLSDVLGDVSEGSRERVMAWVVRLQEEARAGGKWRHAWTCIIVLNAAHMLLPVRRPPPTHMRD